MQDQHHNDDQHAQPIDKPPSVPSNPLLDRSAIQLSSDDWWSFDTAKHGFFFERCCGCGLVHKTHIRIEGTRIHFRNERLEGDPPPEMVDQSSVVVSNPCDETRQK